MTAPKPRLDVDATRERLRTHWGKERLVLVVLGVVSFYVTYVSYRNLKSNLPFVRDADPDPMKTEAVSFDHELHIMDKVLFFGHDPSSVLQGLLGHSFTAHLLSPIYLFFLPMVPIGVLPAGAQESGSLNMSVRRATPVTGSGR